MDFKNYLQTEVGGVNDEVDHILSKFLEDVKKTKPKLLPLALAFIKSCKGGKRIRAVLVKLGYEMTQSVILSETKDLSRMRVPNESGDSSLIVQNDKSQILKVGASLEILHTAILIHDDVIDQSPIRRSQPTFYKALGGDHYGISQAIGMGDIGLYLPIKIICDTSFPSEVKIKAISHLSQTIVDTGWGEVLDMELPKLKHDEEDVIMLYKLKTAQYTISGPLILGAILAGAEDGLIKSLNEFGEKLGIAFQIQDDILGVFGDEASLGKSTSSDIEEGKNTLLLSESLKRANKEQKEVLDQYYGKSSGVDKVREVFKQSGVLDYCTHKALQYVLSAKELIPNITKDPKMSNLLGEMADYLIERNK